MFLFIIFGAFLVRSGAGEFVIALARAVAGRVAGGPGLVAVISSALTGTISGSAVANTASTGVITIPLMKKAGYKPAFAGGVEAASSTGGQLMPPIMGAGAFVMASFTQISYETIVLVAILPAILYFASVAFFVRMEARRLNLPPLESRGRDAVVGPEKGRRAVPDPDRHPDRDADGGLHAELCRRVQHRRRDRGVLGVGQSAGPQGHHPRRWSTAPKGMIMTAILLCSVGLVVNVITTAGDRQRVFACRSRPGRGAIS